MIVMQPVLSNFCQRVNNTKSIKQIVALLANHPKLIASLAQFHRIFIRNSIPIVVMNHVTHPCDRETFVDNLLSDTKFLIDGSSFNDVNDPMSPAYHHPIHIKITSNATNVSNSLSVNSQVSSQAIAKSTSNPDEVFGDGLDKINTTSSAYGSSHFDTSQSIPSGDSYIQSILANYNPQMSMDVKMDTDKLVDNAINNRNPKIRKKKEKQHYKKHSESNMKARFNSAFNSSTSSKPSFKSSSNSVSKSSNASNHSNVISTLTTKKSQSLNGTSPFA